MLELWENFQATGKISDYLQYAEQKGNYDNQGCCSLTENMGRTG